MHKIVQRFVIVRFVQDRIINIDASKYNETCFECSIFTV